MHSRQVISYGLLLAAMQLCPSASALEAATATNDRASNAAMVRHFAAERADQFAELAALETQVTALLKCTKKGRFYTPGETGADSDGCAEIQVTVVE